MCIFTALYTIYLVDHQDTFTVDHQDIVYGSENTFTVDHLDFVTRLLDTFTAYDLGINNVGLTTREGCTQKAQIQTTESQKNT